MRQVVKDAFFQFSVGHEGFASFMYADSKNLVTTGIGTKIDTSSNDDYRQNNDTSESASAPAMWMPWKRRAAAWTNARPVGTELATPAEVRQAWLKVKNDPRKGQVSSGMLYEGVTDLTLDMAGLTDVFCVTRDSTERYILKQFPDYESWPADAQLAIMSMGWAMGGDFANPARGEKAYPTFRTALQKTPPDFVTAANECKFKGGEYAPAGKVPRNEENRQMFLIAADVQTGGTDPDILHYINGTYPAVPMAPSARMQAQLAKEIERIKYEQLVTAPSTVTPMAIITGAAAVAALIGVGFAINHHLSNIRTDNR